MGMIYHAPTEWRDFVGARSIVPFFAILGVRSILTRLSLYGGRVEFRVVAQQFFGVLPLGFADARTDRRVRYAENLGRQQRGIFGIQNDRRDHPAGHPQRREDVRAAERVARIVKACRAMLRQAAAVA